jgi:hypothetical protein
MAELEARPIFKAFVGAPVLAHCECDLCGDKLRDKLIAVESEQVETFSMALCGKCAQRLVWVLPRLIKELGGATVGS